MKTSARTTWAKKMHQAAGLSAVVGLMVCSGAMAAAVFEKETTQQETSISYMPVEQTTYESSVVQPVTVERETSIQQIEPVMPAQPVVEKVKTTRTIEQPMLYSPASSSTAIENRSMTYRSAEPIRVEREITTITKETKVRPGGVTDALGDIAAFPFHLTGGIIQAIF